LWCVMGGGSWNNGGLTPGHFCAWSKATLGWVAPKVVKKAATRKLKAVEHEKKQVYRLWSKGKQGNEYFLIENRQHVGFDTFLPAGGLLVWHIDDSQHNNDHPASYWVGLRQADGLLDLENSRNDGDAGDTYPGTSNKVRIDGTTTPNSNDRLGSPTGVTVTNIAMSNKVVSCRVKV
jgi:immune inhibitor A